MRLRSWQTNCIKLALNRFYDGQRHFFALATPGAGKTVMAANLANQLFEKGLIDYVVCFAPSIAVLESIKTTFTKILKKPMHGHLGASGGVFSYQYLANSKKADWSFFKESRVLVIFDEIHHCAGDDPNEANAWGREVLSNIGKHAQFILSMTGTPWRSDNLRISLATYIEPDNSVKCDFVYGILDAIKDRVCRLPMVTLIDNDKLQVNDELYDSLSLAIEKSDLKYSEIIKHEAALKYLMSKAIHQLKIARAEQPNAAGLVVASSIQEALRIQQLLQNDFRQSTVMVSYKEQGSQQKINNFRTSNIEWIISIGMVSEGTDIPRLRVCAHLSLTRTELFFRQVLGRVIRLIPCITNDMGWLFSFAEPSLLEFAQRLQNDIPHKILNVEKIDNLTITGQDESESRESSQKEHVSDANVASCEWNFIDIESSKIVIESNTQQLLFSLQGDYKEQVFSIFNNKRSEIKI